MMSDRRAGDSRRRGPQEALAAGGARRPLGYLNRPQRMVKHHPVQPAAGAGELVVLSGFLVHEARAWQGMSR